MNHVEVSALLPNQRPDEAYEMLRAFDRYPEYTDSVIRVDMSTLVDNCSRCDWEVRFRRGILKWTEEDRFDDEARRADFHLIDGDIDHFVGYWMVTDAGSGSLYEFAVEFDMGIPTLAHIIEPIAARTLRDNMVRILEGLFGVVNLREPADLIAEE